MITYEEVRRILDYDYDRGILLWKSRPELSAWWNEKFADQPVALEIKKGYAHITIRDKQYRVHRVIWLWHYGEWPKHTIDHINLNKLDNRIENMRDVTATVNGMHQRDSRLGIRQDGDVWTVALKIEGKWGARRFRTYDEAFAKRELLKERLLIGSWLTKQEAGWNNSRG